MWSRALGWKAGGWRGSPPVVDFARDLATEPFLQQRRRRQLSTAQISPPAAMSVPQYEFTELEEEVFDENMDYGVQQSGYDELYNEAESGTSTTRWDLGGMAIRSAEERVSIMGSWNGSEGEGGQRASWE